jgi:hypothetical protein
MIRGRDLVQRETAAWVALVVNHWRGKDAQITPAQILGGPSTSRKMTAADVERTRERCRAIAAKWRETHGHGRPS